jgi:predicted nuclease of predicted toxin-antitoxin system
VKLLLDQGLPRSAAPLLLRSEIESIHVSDLGLSSASDEEILAWAKREGRVVVTLDADFHSLLAQSGASGPSVIRFRIEGLRGEGLAELLLDVIGRCEEYLKTGAMVTVTERRIGVRKLPVLR